MKPVPSVPTARNPDSQTLSRDTREGVLVQHERRLGIDQIGCDPRAMAENRRRHPTDRAVETRFRWLRSALRGANASISWSLLPAFGPCRPLAHHATGSERTILNLQML